MAEADAVAAETSSPSADEPVMVINGGDPTPQPLEMVRLADTPKRGGRPSKSRGAPKSSDKGEDRWTIRGVPLNVRKLVLVEAERRGLTLGDMVAEALVGYLKAKSAEEPVSAAKDVTVPKPEELAAQVAQVLERMTALESQRRSLWARLFG